MSVYITDMLALNKINYTVDSYIFILRDEKAFEG